MKTFLILLFISSSLCAQWLTDYRLTNYPGNSYASPNGQRNIAANGSILHVVWYDAFIGNYLIYYTRSTDGGATWGSDTNLILTNYESVSPCISASGSSVHTVWTDRRIGNDEIYYKRSTNDGISWLPEVRLTDNVNTSDQPVVASSGLNVHVFWHDTRSSANEIYYKRSTDGGATWGEDTRVTNFAGVSHMPAVTLTGSTIHLVWDDSRAGANTEIYYKRSTDNGTTWESDTRLTNSAELSSNPSVAVSGNTVHVAWDDYRNGNYEIYYKNSKDGGTTWGTDMRFTNDAQSSNDPSIEAAGSLVHVVWEDRKDGVFKIYYNLSTNNGVTWGTEAKLTTSTSFTSESRNPSIACSGGALHVVWHDFRDDNYEIYYDKNPSGNAIGIQSISSEIPEGFSLSQNYPNPFNPVTNIEFEIPKQSFVKITIYDVLGNEVNTLVNEEMNAGKYRADWSAASHPSGIYFYKIESGGFTQTKRMVLIK